MESNIKPTPRQLCALKLYWLVGNRKSVAEFMGINVKTLEYHLRELSNKVEGRESRDGSSYIMTKLFKWGVRAGILTMICFTCYARPWWKHPPQPPPPPPSLNYQTNILAWWQPVPNASAYYVNWRTGNAVALGTNWTITGVTNGSNYIISVQSSVNGLLSVNSCLVTIRAGSGVTNSCPTTSLPILNTLTQ